MLAEQTVSAVESGGKGHRTQQKVEVGEWGGFSPEGHVHSCVQDHHYLDNEK